MNTAKKPTRLRNKYSNDIVFCEDYTNVNRDVAKNMEFIRIYSEKDPKRTYLANKEAFDILPD